MHALATTALGCKTLQLCTKHHYTREQTANQITHEQNKTTFYKNTGLGTTIFPCDWTGEGLPGIVDVPSEVHLFFIVLLGSTMKGL